MWRSVRAHVRRADLEIEARPVGSAATYTVSLDEHLTALGMTATLSGLVLVQSWSLAEALGRVALRQDDLGQIEQWAPLALGANRQGVGRVAGGLAGLVESYVVRNAVAHGLPFWTGRMANRVVAAGGPAHRRGETFDLSDDGLEEYRASVRSLMRLMGLRASN